MKLRNLHRIREARQQAGLTESDAARLLNISLVELGRQENSGTDLTISELQCWLELLQVDVDDILVDQEVPFPRAVMLPERLGRLLHTANTMRDATDCPALQRLATTLADQLQEINPE